MIDGKQICQFVYNDELGWWEVSLTQIATACEKSANHITRLGVWKDCVNYCAKHEGVSKEKVFRTVIGGSWAHFKMATTFASFCNTSYIYDMNKVVFDLYVDAAQ